MFLDLTQRIRENTGVVNFHSHIQHLLSSPLYQKTTRSTGLKNLTLVPS
jgi:hypothetical protein